MTDLDGYEPDDPKAADWGDRLTEAGDELRKAGATSFEFPRYEPCSVVPVFTDDDPHQSRMAEVEHERVAAALSFARSLFWEIPPPAESELDAMGLGIAREIRAAAAELAPTRLVFSSQVSPRQFITAAANALGLGAPRTVFISHAHQRIVREAIGRGELQHVEIHEPTALRGDDS